MNVPRSTVIFGKLTTTLSPVVKSMLVARSSLAGFSVCATRRADEPTDKTTDGDKDAAYKLEEGLLMGDARVSQNRAQPEDHKKEMTLDDCWKAQWPGGIQEEDNRDQFPDDVPFTRRHYDGHQQKRTVDK